MFRKMTNGSVKLVEKYLPDAFLFAIFLTIITLVLGMLSTGQSFLTMVSHWGNGVWGLLAFSMQMTLVLVTGHALASSPPIKKILKKLAKLAKTPGQAIIAVSLVSAIGSWLNWGFGLVIGALYAQELAKEVEDVDYRLLIASAYTGFLLWHGGISASIPLSLATPGADLEIMTGGAVTEVIPTSQTIFSPLNVIISAVVIITLPFINRAMHPSKEETITVDRSLLVDDEEAISKLDDSNETPADRIENSKIITYIIVAISLIYIVGYFMEYGFALNLNIVNLIFLTFGMLFHQTPRRYIYAVAEATKGASGIILQFPFYAGIMGMMTGKIEGGASLAENISNWFVSVATERTFPILSFLAAGIVNFFVPSGGGQWAVQGPIMMPAGLKLGVDPAKTALAIAWGDAWTNMIQPFWALPALGIAGLGARDIMGFCLMVLLYSGIIISLAFLLI